MKTNRWAKQNSISKGGDKRRKGHNLCKKVNWNTKGSTLDCGEVLAVILYPELIDKKSRQLRSATILSQEPTIAITKARMPYS